MIQNYSEFIGEINVPAIRRIRLAGAIRSSGVVTTEMHRLVCGGLSTAAYHSGSVDLRIGPRSYINAMRTLARVITHAEFQSESHAVFSELSARLVSECDQLRAAVNVVQCEEMRRADPGGALFETALDTSRRPDPSVAKRPAPPDLHEHSLEEQIRMLLAPPASVELDSVALAKKPMPFQFYGIQWLMDRNAALLADEMGLGKTMQAILAARLLWRRGKIETVLVVCPSPLVDNWRREIELWWPGVAHGNVHVCPGGRRRLPWLRMATDRHTVKIISYPMLARALDELEDLKQPILHDLMIIDEAQVIKNPRSKSSRAIKLLSSSRRWALTGTPIENRLSDLVSIFEYVKPGLISRADEENSNAIKRAVADYMLRRRAVEVLEELPGLDQQEVSITMQRRQLESYLRIEREGVARLNAKGDSVSMTHVFQLIGELRKACNFDVGSGESAKRVQLWADLQEIMADGGKALVFGEYVSDEFGLNGLAEYLRSKARGSFVVDVISGDTASKREGIIQAFQAMTRPGVLLIQYRAGGVGLNLQQASHVFLFDRWWNPAVEDQAIARAHRLGQTRVVLARKFMCVNTIEERIVSKIKEKRRLFGEVIESESMDQAHAMGLSNEEVFDLFEGLDARPPYMAPGSKGKVKWENIDWNGFEELVAKYYEHQGCDVKRTGGPSDHGVDLLIRRGEGELAMKSIVQCKMLSKPCGPEVVRALGGTLAFDPEITHRILALWGNASREAKSEASRLGIKILEGEPIRDYCAEHGLIG